MISRRHLLAAWIVPLGCLIVGCSSPKEATGPADPPPQLTPEQLKGEQEAARKAQHK
jgi:hypothetical protein